MVFLDGFGIYAALKFLGYKNVQKFNATDLYMKVFNYLSTNQYRLFLIGGSFSEKLVNQKASENKLAIVGYQTGYFDEINLSTIIDKIDESSAKLIVIGMGVPKQEFLTSEIAKSFPDKLILCVGNFLEFYFGTITRAPIIFRILGLEWLHRLLTEPKRLWKRYLIGIPVFIFHIFKLKFSSTQEEIGKN
jgi:exopolysaccharide biosynthesis WecB/TagA/CpsF family protein